MGPGEIIIIVAAGLAAGFVNTIAGGGSLLSLPALMLAGLPADMANGTNRVAIILQSAGAASGFHHAGALPIRRGLTFFLPTIAGAIVGAVLASQTPVQWLEPILLTTLLVVAATIAWGGRRAKQPHTAAPVPPRPRDHLFLFGAGLYGGFIQAGLGFLLLAVLHGNLKLSLVSANAMKVLIAGGLTVAALCIFMAAGQVQWGAGLILGGASVIGARVGVRFTLEAPSTKLRWAILACVALSCALIALRGTPN
jgi:uncharacterized membrane protein YfcA